MKINFKKCNEKELWQFVSVHLKKKGIDTILVGGAVVSIYTEGFYQSGDIDLVKSSLFVENLDESMSEIGFKKVSRHFVHPDCKHIFVEFPGSFLQIGEDKNITPDEFEIEGVAIKILSPTDCVKDRLASYIYFAARECFDQAVMVASQHPVDWRKIKTWCDGENRLDVFDKLKEKVE